MTKITESEIEQFAIEFLEKQGYGYIYAPDVVGARYIVPLQASCPYKNVLLMERLQSAVGRINPSIPADIREDAIKQIQRLNSPELIANNEAFHRMLTEGIKVGYQKNGYNRGDLVWLIDFMNPENNDFLVANQFTVIENNINKRPDVILFVNGLPLVVIELKNPADENATIRSAFKQLQTYKQAIPGLFTYNGFMIISDGLEAKAGSISAGLTRFMAWKTSDGKEVGARCNVPLPIGQLETLIKGMLNKKTLLDLIRHFIVFEKSKKEDRKTGIITIQTEKKLAAYHQYYAVNRAVESTLRAAEYLPVQKIEESPASYGLPGVKKQPSGNRKGGVVWHTQGSGKSLSMFFYTGKIVLVMDNPTVLVITDRNDLDDQLFDTFAASKQLLRQEPVQAENRDHLKELLKVASGGVVFTTIQKFQPDEGNVYETLSARRNIIVIADEAHRTQYGFKAKTIDAKDENGNVVGKKIVYGFAKYLRDALPNATYLGFTGTPIESHNLMQAIARVNRVYKDKPGGLVVDYLGIASDLKKALSFYSDSGGKGDPAIAQEKAVQMMLEKLEVVSQIFHGFAYEEYFEADTGGKLSLILAAEEHILGLKNGKKRYINEVTALSRAFSIAIPHEQAMDVKDEVSFFQAVKSRLAKFDSTGFGKTDEEVETAIRQVIDKALVTERVVDIFDAAGINKPDISILSEEFLLEVKNMEHKNIALEVLKKLLNDEIKTRTKKNLIQSKSLMEMLENSIKKYHKKILTAAEVIEELIELSKEIQKMDKEPQEMGLSDFEYAFYTAIANNDSARELMEKDKLRELAVVLFEKVKANASIDWTIKESVKAKLKIIVKRTLRQYGYPPDMQKLATETVLKQAELIAEEITRGK
ncbi:type I restriction enzyme, R subunit [Desulfosarcina sp. BuS5]|uniref:type I restriction endonuclease subunit R n=1 Tax=Desulfosarcina sp. BuS5 TaxID=933262 RepID=UPI000A654C16|nr:HsdR family type I site-specific deoxyribonuclease [Desulfosarcina sp. BuS5]WDN87611.1 type I restriction enzyme, R subunit [Desulfosarcina sp. BuS5]